MPIVAFFFYCVFVRLLSSSTLCVPLLRLSENLDFLDGDLLLFDGVCLAIYNPCFFLTFGTYSLWLILSYSALWCCWFVWASVVVTGCCVSCLRGFDYV